MGARFDVVGREHIRVPPCNQVEDGAEALLRLSGERERGVMHREGVRAGV
jgi:hypothetical protein